MAAKSTNNILAIYDDLPDGVHAEIIDGMLYVEPSPAFRHINVQNALGEILRPPFQRGRGGPGGWWILTEPEIRLGGERYEPDVAGWRTERLPSIEGLLFTDVAPDWICEVLSTNRERDEVTKLRAYARARVGWYWIIDPLERRLVVYELTGDVYSQRMLARGTDVVRIPPFEAIELQLGELWAK